MVNGTRAQHESRLRIAEKSLTVTDNYGWSDFDKFSNSRGITTGRKEDENLEVTVNLGV